jgi:hypothetical protein
VGQDGLETSGCEKQRQGKRTDNFSAIARAAAGSASEAKRRNETNRREEKEALTVAFNSGKSAVPLAAS